MFFAASGVCLTLVENELNLHHTTLLPY